MISNQICPVRDYVVERCILRNACVETGLCPLIRMTPQQFDVLVESLSQPELRADLEHMLEIRSRRSRR